MRTSAQNRRGIFGTDARELTRRFQCYCQLAAITAHAALRSEAVQMRAHVAAGLHLGWTKADIIEVLIQVAAHAGVPASLQALSACHDLLVEMDPHCASCRTEESSGGQV